MRNLLEKLRELEAEKPKPVLHAEISQPYHYSEIFSASLFTGVEEATPQRLSELYRLPLIRQFRREEVLFLDTETTGLSGGAGTVAFEVGLGYFSGHDFVVEQFMLHSYAEEPAMLKTIASVMKRFSMIATFNGRTFDIPLLKSRFLINRISESALPELHADVLYPCRRLWKVRLHQCNLGHLEEELLGVVREDDLPGALVPQTFFQYQKDGNFAPMQNILKHNRQDIVSLAQLFFFLCRYTSHPENVVNDEDLLSLAGEYSRSGHREEEKKCYRILSRGKLRPEAYARLACREKQEGHTETAVRLYQAMLKRGEHPVESCIALAKLYEHQLQNPETALAYTRKALLLLSEPTLFPDPSVQETKKALQYRYARLCRKCPASKEETVL